jgi:uncharacterized Zn finger protein
MRRRDFGWGYYKPSRPRATAGGIKARTRSGAFGKSWWARRWIEVLESFNIGKRLGRGRSYARGGQVTDIDISEGKVRAKVQGPHLPDEPLSADTESFWGKEDVPAEPAMEVRIPATAAALPRRLGSFPFWRGGEDFLDAVSRIYSSASERGMAVILGSPIPSPPSKRSGSGLVP